MIANVLIVEDEHELAELVQMYLRNDGVEAVIAGSAEEGFAQLDGNDYDLIILDINLPGMDGFDFVQRLRKTSAVPVIIVSAREADEDIVMGLGVGADEFVTKPFAPKVLVARVRALPGHYSHIAQGSSCQEAHQKKDYLNNPHPQDRVHSLSPGRFAHDQR